MTTNEFIEMLRKEDPEGNSHLRFPDGIPVGCEMKAGYWDGPYSYINEKGQYVYSTKGSKIDIYFEDADQIVYDTVDKWNPYLESKDGLWDKVKEQYVFELDYVHNQERIDNFLKSVRETYDHWVEHHRESWYKHLNEVIELYKKGCKFYRSKEVKNKFYEWKFINETNPKEIAHACKAITYPILMSGRFEKIECNNPTGLLSNILNKNDWYEFVLIEN